MKGSAVVWGVLVLLFLIFGVLVFLGLESSKKPIVRIATGSTTGVYNDVGAGACRAVGEEFSCEYINTKGSVDNVNRLNLGEVEFGVVQEDVLLEAENVLSIGRLYPESFLLVIKEGSEFEDLSQIKNAMIYIGEEGSGTRKTTEYFFEKSNMSFIRYDESLKADEMLNAFCDDTIDGFTYIIGNPNRNMIRAINECGGKIFSFPEDVIDVIINDKPFYKSVIIPKSVYDTYESARTFGVYAHFVVSESVSEELRDEFKSEIIDNIEIFREENEIFSDISFDR